MNRLPFRSLGRLVSTSLVVSCGFAFSVATMSAQAPPTAVGSTSSAQAMVKITTSNGLNLATISVVTQGATGQDYQLAGGGTCTVGSAYNVGDFCTVNYTFAPKHPWVRYGGISLTDTAGTVIGNAYLTGMGTGPQTAYPPSASTVPPQLFSGSDAYSVALDGNGNLYFTDLSTASLREIAASGGVISTTSPPAPSTIATGFTDPVAVAVDGSGNIFVLDLSSGGSLKEIVAVGGTIPAGATPTTVVSGLGVVTGIAVGGTGNIYVGIDSTGAVKEIDAVDGVVPPSPTPRTLSTTAGGSNGVAVDASGDVYFTAGSTQIEEFVAVAGVIPANPTPVTLATVNADDALTIDSGGNLYVADYTGKSVYEIQAVNGSFTGVPNPAVVTLYSGLIGPHNLAVDASGNIFIAENSGTVGSLDELNVQTPPTVTFTSTSPMTASSDSPMTLTVENNGSTPLVFAVPAAGDTNPSPSPGFVLGTATMNPCPQSTTTTVSLPEQTSCNYAISFDPSAVGPVTGTLTFTDNNLNAPVTTQQAPPVPLDGGVGSPTVTVIDASAPVDTTSITLTAMVAFNGIQPVGPLTFSVNGGAPITATCTGTTSPLTCTASFDDSSLQVGTYPIVANLPADESNNAEMGAGTLTVTAATPVVSVMTSAPTTAVNIPVTFTATVTPNSGILPSGTVNFTATPTGGSATTIPNCGAQTLSATQHTATCTTSALTAASYIITANLAGDMNFNPASGTVGQLVVKAMPGVSVTASTNNAPVNTGITFTAAVTPTTGILPTGSVSFSTTQGTTTTPIASCSGANAVPLSATTHTAACPTSALPAGSYTVTATYLGDGNFTTQTSPGLSQTVALANPALVLSTSGTPSIVNGFVTFTALVTPNSGILPGGTVVFSTSLNGGTATPIAGCNPVSLTGSGTTFRATCTTAALQGGSNAVTATIAADSNFNSVSSNTVTQQVNPATPTLTLATSGSPSVVDNTVTFTATVTPNTGIVPGGKVNFTTTLGVVTTTLCSAVPLVPGTGPTSLTAACPTAALMAGANTITATLAADTNFLTASNTVAQSVTKAPTTLAITSSMPASSAVDQPVTFTATLSATAPFTVTPAGTVSFSSNGVAIASCSGANAVALDATNHTAICATSALVVPSDVITASYSGDANFQTSSAPQFTQIVTQAAPLVAVISSLPTAVVNQTVTFTATITPPLASANGVPPTGNVKFTTGSGGPIACGPVVVTSNANGTGTATCSTAFTNAFASTNIFAVYSGDTNFTAGNSPDVAQIVSAAPTTTSVSLPDNPSIVNQSVTLIATITATNTGAGYPGTATPQSGTVVFNDSLDPTGSPFCSTPVTATGGVISPVNCTHTFTSTGPHIITAVFTSSDPNFANSTTQNPATQTVNTAGTTGINVTTVPSPLTPAPIVNQTVTFAASFTPKPVGAQPQGTVTYDDSALAGGTIPGGAIPGCANLAINNGVIPNCTETMLVAGTHNISVVYTPTTGNTNFAPITSPPFPQAVAANSTTVALTVTPAASVTDQVLTFAATVTPVTPPAAGNTTPTNPTGTVSFFLNSSTTAICSSPVSVTAGVASASCQAPITAAGTYSVTAGYLGDSNFTAATSTPHSQVVSKEGTSLGVSGASFSTPSSPAVNQPATYSVQISPATAGVTYNGSTAPTGTVTFTDASIPAVTCSVTPLATGVASCSLTEPTSGAHTINVTYNGDSNFSGSSTSLPVSIGLATVTVSNVTATPNPPTVNQPTALNATVTPTNSGTIPQGTVTFTDSPGGGTCQVTLTPTGVVPPCSYIFTSAGPHTVTATYSGDGNFSPATSTAPQLSVNVTAAGTTITLTSSATSVVVNQGVNYSAVFAGLPSNGAQPSGTVTYDDGGSPIAGCVALPVVDNTPPTAPVIPGCSETMTTAGTHNITIMYVPATTEHNFSGITSPQLAETVAQNTTVVSLTSPTATSSVVDQTQTFTATVAPFGPLTPPAVGTNPPTGVVTFSSDRNGVICSAAVSTATVGTVTTTSASCPGVLTPAGSPADATGMYQITASYAGDTNFKPGASTPFAQTVTKEATVVSQANATLSSPANPQVGQPAQYSVQVSLANPAGETGTTIPTGTVKFTNNANSATCTAVVPTTGLAQCTFADPTGGSQIITAMYSGDNNFSPASMTFTQPIGKNDPGGISVTSSSSVTPTSPVPTSIAGQAVIFRASVSPAAGGATPINPTTAPNFTFSITQGSTTVPCATYTQSAVGDPATASCTVFFQSPLQGMFNVTATYNGDNDYNAITSAPPIVQSVQDFVLATSPAVIPATPTTPIIPITISLAQGSAVLANTNVSDAYVAQPISYSVLPEDGFVDTLTATCDFLDSSNNVIPGGVAGLTCVPTQPALDPTTGHLTGSVLITASAIGNPLAPGPAVGVYSALLTIKDNGVGLQQTAPLSITVINQPAPVFTAAVGQTAPILFTLPSTLVAANPASALVCGKISSYDPQTKLYTPLTFSGVGITCSPITSTTTGSVTTYSFTITAGQPSATSRLDTRNNGVLDAWLGAPFLLLFGLLPAFRKQRKSLLRGLGMLLLGIAVIQTTGCGGGGFTKSTPPQAVTGSYLIAIQNTNTQATVAEISLIIGNN